MNNVLDEISPIINRSRNELDLSGIVPHDIIESKADTILTEKSVNKSTSFRNFEYGASPKNKITNISINNVKSSIIQTNDDTLTKEIVKHSTSFVERSNKINKECDQEKDVANINTSTKELNSSESVTNGNWLQIVAEGTSSNNKSRSPLYTDAEINENFPTYRRSVRLSLKSQENKENCYCKNITEDFVLSQKLSNTSNFKVPSSTINFKKVTANTDVFQTRRSLRLSMKKDKIHSNTNLGNQTRKSEIIYCGISHAERNRSQHCGQIVQEQNNDVRLNEHLSSTFQRNNSNTINKNRGKTGKTNTTLNKYCENFYLDSGSKCITTENKSLSKSKLKFSLKKALKDTYLQLNDSSILEMHNNSKDVIGTSQGDEFDQSTFKTFPVFARRRSKRLSAKTSRLITSSPNDLSFILQKPKA